MQKQGTLQQEATGTTLTATAREPAGGRLKRRHIFLGGVAGVALIVASIFAIQALTSEQTASETLRLSPVTLIEEDPPLSGDWVDPYFARPVVIPDQDPPLPEGWVDPYFTRSAAIPEQEDPPLPKGWVDPYFQTTD